MPNVPNVPAWQQCRLRWNLRDYLGAGGSVVSTKFRYGVNTVHVTTGDAVNITAVAAQADYRWIDGILCDKDGNEGVYVIASEDPDIDPQGWSVSIEVVVSSGQKLKASIPSTPVGGDLDVSAYVGLPTPPAGIVVDPDGELTANSDQRLATQKAVRTYVGTFGGVPVSRTINGHPLTDDVTITKGDVGLNNVNNTADLNKPISNSTQAALDGKADKATLVNGHPLSADVTVTKADVGLGSVDNTADTAKPVSTAQQTALNGKVDKSGVPNGVYLNDGSGVPATSIVWSLNPDAFTVPVRDGNGRAQFADPAAAQDAATKAYVDAADVSTLISANTTAAAGDATTLASASGRAIAFSIALGD